MYCGMGWLRIIKVLNYYDQIHTCEWWVHLCTFQAKDISESEWRIQDT